MLKEIVNEKKYGFGSSGKGKKANVEFVSANPTGPLTIGHGRNAVLGDCISNILEWNGYNVTREYYYNDAGRQMRILGQSVEARYFEILGKKYQFPEDGYLKQRSIFNDIKKSLSTLNIVFDEFVNEKTFYENGEIDQLLMELKNKDLIYEKDGATWFKSTALGKEQDRVYIKNTGEPTYRVPDTAYHKNKIDRDYDLIVDSRDSSRYRGEYEPIDKAAGHIPGAINRFWKKNIVDTGCFKDRHTLLKEFKQLFNEVLPEDSVFYCGSGVTACHNLLAVKHSGLNLPRLYAGSWSEWCATKGKPVATGN